MTPTTTPRTYRRGLVRALATFALVGLAACSGGSDGADRLLVFAPASLTDAAADLAEAFTAETGVEVRLNIAGSASLREQVLSGAPADVIIAANDAVMAQLVEAGEIVEGPVVVARNSMTIVVPADNPGGVSRLGDLARTDLLVGLCAPGVPCGDLARAVLAAADVEPSLDTNEPDVRALLTKVAERELDVAIVYATDVIAGGDRVVAIDLPSGIDMSTPYPIAVLAGAPNRGIAARFVEFVLSSPGQAILVRHGFLAP